MKFLDLQLLAYGPFTDVRLDFSSLPMGLHVIYGRNEAGKSTTLRAVKGLLYGIDEKTTDAHAHRYGDLRIAARLSGDDGSVLDVVRRKGRKDTLSDPQDKLIDDVVLRRLLHGVGQDQFATMFGLDHETLRRGGEALLRGGGELGESLFEAGLGGGAPHDVLASLRDEAENLFTPQAHRRPLNEALKKFAEAQKRARDSALASDAWVTQQQGITDARERRIELEGEIRKVQVAHDRLKRAEFMLPLAAERTQAIAARRALGEVVALPERAGRDREDAQREVAEATAAAARLDVEVRDLEALRATLHVPERLLGEELRMKALDRHAGSQEKAQTDLPRIRGELLSLEARARSLARNLPVAGVQDFESLRVDAATQARIKKLAQREPLLAQEHARLQKDLGELEAQLAAAERNLQRQPMLRDGRALKAVIARALHDGDVSGRLKKLAVERTRLSETAAGKLSALGLWSGALANVPTLPVPGIESVTHHEERWAAIARKSDKLAETVEILQARGEAVELEIARLRSEGDVPTEEDLRTARDRRDDAWQALKKQWEPTRAAAYETVVSEADQVADRLRREAKTVARLAQALAERDAIGRQRATMAEQQSELAGERTAAERDWRGLWAPVGIEPRSPAEMRGWLGRFVALSSLVEQLTASTRDEDEARTQRDAHLEDLAAALVAAGEPIPADEELAARLERAQALLAATENASRERETLNKTIEALGDAQRLQRGELERCEAERARWQAAWSDSIRALGLPPDATAEAALAVLDVLGELFKIVDDAADRRRRVEGIERDAVEFAGEVQALVRDHAPELLEHPADKAAEQLLKQYQNGRIDLTQRTHVDQQLFERRRTLSEQSAQCARGEARLSELMAAAGVVELKALGQAEQRSIEARALDERVGALETQLLQHAEATTLAALEAELAATHADAVAGELEALEQRLADLESEKDGVIHTLGAFEEGLKKLDGDSKSADAAAEAQGWLAHARTHLERYLRVRTAAVVLSKQIEIYRERNQGPIVTRASELFRRLTVDRYRAVKAGFNERDQAVLRCVRADGREVDVESLSDGTRDQLYLALRLASLARYATIDEPLPLVVDDILIHFDDHRARASLEVLSEMTDRIQVLFFTHHARLVELARAAVPESRLREYELP